MSVGMRTLYTRVPSWVITTLDKMAADSRVKRAALAARLLMEAIIMVQTDFGDESEDKA